ncbi:unnamed protein product [Cuscuta europaea]|uniref:Retrotransposon gag domain-containing protein n=1 Tax=Cuscuta europaea TaxID=41803 RepID=A0A9P0YT13_CUSEU|nr:unnamed protein product [Cuscuta europaea]
MPSLPRQQRVSSPRQQLQQQPLRQPRLSPPRRQVESPPRRPRQVDLREEKIRLLTQQVNELWTAATAAPPPLPPQQTARDAQLEALALQVQQLEAQINQEPVTVRVRTATPFTTRIMQALIPPKYKGANIQLYGGKTDPQEHYTRYQSGMYMLGASDEYICRMFPSTLEGEAYDWFNDLPDECIDSWRELATRFLTHFATKARTKKHFSYLLSIKQGRDEPLGKFLERWNEETSKVYGADDNTRLAMLQEVLWTGGFSRSLIIDPPRDYQRALLRGQNYALAEEVHNRKRAQKSTSKPQKQEQKQLEKPKPLREDKPRDDGDKGRNRGHFKGRRPWIGPKLLAPEVLTPLTHSVSHILEAADQEGLVVRDPRISEIQQ